MLIVPLKKKPEKSFVSPSLLSVSSPSLVSVSLPVKAMQLTGIGNTNYSVKPLIGGPFVSLFQVETGEDGSFLCLILPIKKESSRVNFIDDVRETFENLLTIMNFKTSLMKGLKLCGGDEITEDMIANSKTSAFNLEKYLLKKQKKYAPKVLLIRPFAGSLFKEISSHDEACSLLLTMATVTAYSDVLVVDMVGGLVTGAVAECLGGAGIKMITRTEMYVIKMLSFVKKKKVSLLHYL
uniref:Uncharacterized protein n=1 Tax=Brassica oleracea var. oleracea TaxID=109376 RepID=A0A0D3E761_BRAOL